MALLGKLGIVKRHVRLLEIGAAVLHVGIQEERIEAAVEIVVVSDVVSGATARIELPEVPRQIASQLLQLGPAGQQIRLVHQDRQRVGDRAVFDDEGAIHVGFPKRKLGVEQNPAFGVRSQKTRENVLPGPVPASEFCTACGGKGHRAAANELLQQMAQQTVHRNHR